MLHGLGAVYEPLPPDAKALFFQYSDFGAELPDFLREGHTIKPRLPRKRDQKSDSAAAAHLGGRRATSAPRGGSRGVFERPPWDASPPERPTRCKNLEAVLPFKFLAPAELRQLLSKAHRQVRYAGLRVDKCLGLVESTTSQAEQRAAEAAHTLDSDAIRELETHPSSMTAQEAQLLEALDTLERVTGRVLGAMDIQREKLARLGTSAMHAAASMQRGMDVLAQRIQGERSSKAHSRRQGSSDTAYTAAATSSLRHIQTTAANDEALFELQQSAMDAMSLADEVRLAGIDALETTRSQASSVVAARNGVFTATRAVLHTPLTTTDAEARRAAARALHGILSSLSQQEETLTKQESALLRGRFDEVAVAAAERKEERRTSPCLTATFWPDSRTPAPVRGFMSPLGLPNPASDSITERECPEGRAGSSGPVTSTGYHHTAPTTSSATSLNGRALSSRFPPPPFSVPMLGPDCSILGSPLETWIERERAVGVAPMRATSPPRQTAIPDADHTMASWLEARELEQQQDCATSAASLAIDMVDLDVEVGDDDDPFDVA